MTSGGPEIDQSAEGAAGLALAGSTVDFLAGDWTVTRRICDHRAGQVGSFRGWAHFRACAQPDAAHALSYIERGELRLGGHRGPAERRLLILDAGDGMADVRFADGREFYRLDLRTGQCQATHPCRTDEYQVTVLLLSADSYAETWRVTGPSKDYELQTIYTRTTGTSPGSAAGSGEPQ